MIQKFTVSIVSRVRDSLIREDPIQASAHSQTNTQVQARAHGTTAARAGIRPRPRAQTHTLPSQSTHLTSLVRQIMVPKQLHSATNRLFWRAAIPPTALLQVILDPTAKSHHPAPSPLPRCTLSNHNTSDKQVTSQSRSHPDSPRD